MHAHAWNAKINMLEKLQMAATMEAAMFNMHACVCACVRMCVHVRMCVGGAPTQPHPHPPTHPPPRGVPPQISKNTIRLERIKIFRFRLKIWNLKNSTPMGRFFFWWVGGWMGGLVGRKV